MAPNMGQTEGDVVEGSPDIVVGAERTSGESSLVLTLGGSHSPTWGEPLLRWTNPEDPASTLFTLDDTTESMERESLDVGVASMLEALDHARGALANIVIPAGWVLA